MHGAAALLLDPGMGKTSIVLKAFDMLLKAKTATRALVVAPLRVAQLVWPFEPNEWADLAHLRIGLLHGKNKAKVLEDAEQYDILVINPEGLEWLICGPGRKTLDAKRWKALGLDTLIIDELTRFKSTKGARFKLLKQVLEKFQRRWGLTGTPAPNGLMDLFGQMYVLDLGRSLGKYVTHYRNKYFFNPDGMGWKWLPRAGSNEEIYERIKPLAMRAAADDYLDLPEIVPLKLYVELPTVVAKLYDKVETDFIAKLEDDTVTAANAAAAATKCRQIANGAVYIDDDISAKAAHKEREVLVLHDAKLDALEELFCDLQGDPLLVAYEFNHDLHRLRERFPAAPYIGAGVSGAEAAGIEKAWNGGDIPILFGHPQSMGHGLNFQKSNAAHVCWFSMLWDLELYDQFIARVRRQGNKALRVFVHHIMARTTIDETIFYVQRSKAKTQGALLAALKGRVR